MLYWKYLIWKQKIRKMFPMLKMFPMFVPTNKIDGGKSEGNTVTK